MIIVLRPDATKKDIDHIIEKVKKLGLKVMVSQGVVAHHHRHYWRRGYSPRTAIRGISWR